MKGFIEKFREEFEARVKQNRSFVSLNVVHGRRATASTLVTTNV